MKSKLIGFIFLVGFFLFPQTSEDSPLQKADQAFKEGRYGESAILYQEAAIRGSVNGSLYYNQGNSWFMAGEVHRAHLSYLKGETLSPGDGDIKRNLSLVRAISGEQTEASSRGELMKVLFFWHYDLSFRYRLILFACFNVLFWLGLIAFTALGKRRKLLFWPLMGTAFFTVSLLISLGVSQSGFNNHPVGVTLSETTPRKGDGESFEEAFNRPLAGGTEFTLLDQRSQWYRIKLADGSEGWIKEGDAGLVSFP
jgi:hypothetical protein